MIKVEREIDRILTLLRNKIREQGFTQLQVQAELEWGRSYISQLLTKQKSLRVEQVLLILDVIGIDPSEFYAELYRFPSGDVVHHRGDPYGPHRDADAYEVAERRDGGQMGRVLDELRESRTMLAGLVELLVKRGVLKDDDQIVFEASGPGPSSRPS